MPYRTSCDALSALLTAHSEEFTNWKDYKIINVAGYDTDIGTIDAVRNYKADKSILDEAVDIPFDSVLLEIDDLREMISNLKPLKNRKGIELEPQIGDGTDLDVPAPPVAGGATETGHNNPPTNEQPQGDDFQKKLAAYYMRILFYAFLIDDEVTSLKQIIEGIDANDNNIRIAQHVGIQKQFLQLIFEKGSEFKLSSLDCTIENVNTLGRDQIVTFLFFTTIRTPSNTLNLMSIFVGVSAHSYGNATIMVNVYSIII